MKRSFVLLEVLIALLLATLCLAPLVGQPLKIHRLEKENLERMEMERLADWTFSEIKELLLKNEIPWKKLPQKKETLSYPLPPITLQIPGFRPKTIQRRFELRTAGEKFRKTELTFRSVWVKVFLEKNKYEYRLPIQRQLVK